jgi:hypothetical protein
MKRSLILAALAGCAIPFLAPATPAQAQTTRLYPYCYVQYEGIGRSGSYQCYYRSFAECMATQSGRGGMCHENPEVIALRQAQQQQVLSKPPRRVVR